MIEVRTARNLPALRRRLVEWANGGTRIVRSKTTGRDERVLADLNEDGLYMEFFRHCAAGTQTTRPVLDVPDAALVLTNCERDRLQRGRLYYVEKLTCQKMMHSFEKLGPILPERSWLPSEFGFMYFAEPLDTFINPHVLAAGVENFPPGTGQVCVTAVSWGPWRPQDYAPIWVNGNHALLSKAWSSGGVWFTFWSLQPPTYLARHADEPNIRPLTIENEGAHAWMPPGGDPNLYELRVDSIGTMRWTRMMYTALLLAQQSNLVTAEEEPIERHERKRSTREGVHAAANSSVSVIRLNRPHREQPGGEPGGEGRKYDRWQWEVQGHWRNQAYGPGRVGRRPQWIEEHWKGPDDAPVKPKKDKVYLV